MAISMLKIRRPLGRLIFNMGIAIPGKTVFLIETAPRSSTKLSQLLSEACLLSGLSTAMNTLLGLNSGVIREFQILINIALMGLKISCNMFLSHQYYACEILSLQRVSYASNLGTHSEI